jgi:hypothetical protein
MASQEAVYIIHGDNPRKISYTTDKPGNGFSDSTRQFTFYSNPVVDIISHNVDFCILNRIRIAMASRNI